MNVDTLRRTRRRVDQARYQVAHLEHADTLITESTLLCVPGEGDPAVYFHVLDRFPDDLVTTFRTTKYHRGARTEGLVSESRVLGFMPRLTLRRDFCSGCSLFREQPEHHATYMRYAREASQILERVAPTKAASMREQVAQVLPEWRISDTLYTSGIVNQNNPLRYHFDAGNFKGIWSSMYAVASGCKGGQLVIPEFGVAFSFDRPALIMFDGQALLHGVTPLEKLNAQSYRYSVVFYSLSQLRHCLTFDDELKRIRTVRVQRERKRAGRPST